ncbi:MAG: hypothetical protein A2808_00740 [Candidatus Moranbacteria bacterium RIFCSPHIGHO2_01_FULL_55_24]|nr:MAG: hypothetical protein A2808_00740 [Candidatus Moranbacteria bacterium RIFCSPHIGHO2_01_FULL_55_24]
MQKIYIKNESRAGADYGWLKTHYSFSFANYFDPNRLHFGALRVINDDEIAPGEGFPTHPHRDMEIITIPFEGGLAHKDSMGSAETVSAGEVQVMSAGTGVEHSEFNASETEPVKLIQVWILSRAMHLSARYDQKRFDEALMHNAFLQLVGPDEEDGKLMIQQDAWISRGRFAPGEKTDYRMKKEGNGVYFFVVFGKGTIGDQAFETRDAVGIWETESVPLAFAEETDIIAIEVPMLEL